MTEDRRDEGYLGLFKPKSEEPDGGAIEAAGSSTFADETTSAEPVGDAESPSEEAVQDTQDIPTKSSGASPPTSEAAGGEVDDLAYENAEDAWFTPQAADSGEAAPTLQTLGIAVGAGCLLLMLTAVVVFAFVQVFVRGGEEEDVSHTPTPTLFVAATAAPTPQVAELPFSALVVSSADVRVPVTLPQRLIIGDKIFTVQARVVPAGAWPEVAASGDTATWAYGSVVNYVIVLAPTMENLDLISGLEAGDALRLDISTGVALTFNVSEVTVGTTDDVMHFEQVSPQLTLAVLTDDPAQRLVVSATYFDDEARDDVELTGAAIGLVGNAVIQGPVRITVLETYQVSGATAGLPAGTSYLLMDVTVENIGAEVLEPQFFQTHVIDPSGNRFPLTYSAEQFAHYGIPTEALAPGETVIGSVGYLVTANLEGEYRWIFNPQPGSEYWVIVPVSYEIPFTAPTPVPTRMQGVAIVTVNTNDVFINKGDGLLDIVIRVQNTSAGVVRITEVDVGLNSFTDGQLVLVAPAPQFPWTVEPGALKLFQLQFQLPTADTALLTVQGYTFSIENLGGN